MVSNYWLPFPWFWLLRSLHALWIWLREHDRMPLDLMFGWEGGDILFQRVSRIIHLVIASSLSSHSSRLALIPPFVDSLIPTHRFPAFLSSPIGAGSRRFRSLWWISCRTPLSVCAEFSATPIRVHPHFWWLRFSKTSNLLWSEGPNYVKNMLTKYQKNARKKYVNIVLLSAS